MREGVGRQTRRSAFVQGFSPATATLMVSLSNHAQLERQERFW